MTFSQQQQYGAIGCFRFRKNHMALFGGCPWDIPARFFAAQSQQKGFSGLHAIQRQTGPNEGHRTSLSGDVELPVAADFFCVKRFQRFLSRKSPRRIAKRLANAV
jgi:hypothetical protein